MTWMRSRRTYLVFGSLAILVLLAVWWSRRSPAVSTATQQSIVAVSTSTLSQSVSASGTINPKVQSAVRFTSSGAVTAVNVKVGDAVVAGQSLATIDPTDLQNALDLAQANANSAAASLSSAKASGTATATTLAAANSQVAAANARLATARTALASATLTSPIDGTVAAVNVTVGDQVSGGGTTSGSGSGGNAAGGSAATTSNAQVVVMSTGAWTVATSVSSADLASIKPGLQAQITPTGARQPVFGTVSTVGVIATTSNGVASFPVTIAVTGSPPGLYAGATATVAIIVREVTDAITVPTAAIRTAAGQTTVVKVVDGQQVVVPVQLGMVQGALTQVTAGVVEGDQVVVESATGFGTGGGSGSTGTRTRGTGSGAGQGSGGAVSGGAGGAPAGGAPAGGAPAGAPGGGQ